MFGCLFWSKMIKNQVKMLSNSYINAGRSYICGWSRRTARFTGVLVSYQCFISLSRVQKAVVCHLCRWRISIPATRNPKKHSYGLANAGGYKQHLQKSILWRWRWFTKVPRVVVFPENLLQKTFLKEFTKFSKVSLSCLFETLAVLQYSQARIKSKT